MADALASGASVRKDVGVQVPPSAPRKSTDFERIQYFFFFKTNGVLLTTNENVQRLSIYLMMILKVFLYEKWFK